MVRILELTFALIQNEPRHGRAVRRMCRKESRMVESNTFNITFILGWILILFAAFRASDIAT